MKKIIRYGIYTILFSAVIFGFIFIGTYDFKNSKKASNEKVALKFDSLDKNNKFEEVTIDEAISIIKEDGLILFANPKNKWADKYAYILNEAAKQTDIKHIAITDITVDRHQNNRKYKNLIKALGDYAIADDLGEKHLFMPTFIIIKDKQIIYFDNETAMPNGFMKLDTYWADDLMETKIMMLREQINEYLGACNNE